MRHQRRRRHRDDRSSPDANGGAASFLRSTATGAENGFKITAAEAGGRPAMPTTGLSALTYDPSTDWPAALAQPERAEREGHRQRHRRGVGVQHLEQRLRWPGAWTLSKVSATLIDIQVSAPTPAPMTSLRSTPSSSAYNDLNTYIQAQTKYDASRPRRPGRCRATRPSSASRTSCAPSSTSRFDGLVDVRAPVGSWAFTAQADGGALAADSAPSCQRRARESVAAAGTDSRPRARTIGEFGASRCASRTWPTSRSTRRKAGLSTHYTGAAGRPEAINRPDQDDMQTHLDAEQARLTACSTRPSTPRCRR